MERTIQCPTLGEVKPDYCAERYAKARKAMTWTMCVQCIEGQREYRRRYIDGEAGEAGGEDAVGKKIGTCGACFREEMTIAAHDLCATCYGRNRTGRLEPTGDGRWVFSNLEDVPEGAVRNRVLVRCEGEIDTAANVSHELASAAAEGCKDAGLLGSEGEDSAGHETLAGAADELGELLRGLSGDALPGFEAYQGQPAYTRTQVVLRKDNSLGLPAAFCRAVGLAPGMGAALLFNRATRTLALRFKPKPEQPGEFTVTLAGGKRESSFRLNCASALKEFGITPPATATPLDVRLERGFYLAEMGKAA